MKTCPKCATENGEDALFCEKCGEPLSEAQPIQKEEMNQPETVAPQVSVAAEAAAAPGNAPVDQSRRNRRIGIAVAGVVVVVALILVVAAVKGLSGLFASPADQFVSYQQQAFVDPLLAEVEKNLDTYGNGKFSSDLTLSASVNNRVIDRYLEDSSVVLKIDMNQDSLIANGALNIWGEEVLCGTITYDKGKLGVHLPQADDTYYVADLSELVNLLTGEDIDLSELKAPKISGKEWTNLMRKYLEIIFSAANKDNVEIEKKEKFRLSELGGSYTGTVYTFTPRAEDMEEMIEALADAIEKDKDLRKLVLELIDTEMWNSAFGSDVFDGVDLDSELDEAMEVAAEALREQAAYVGEMVEESGFTWELCMEGKEIRMIRMTTERSDLVIAYECKGKESEGRSQIFYMTSGDEKVCMENTYTKNGKMLEGEITFTVPYDGEIMSVEYETDMGKTSVLGIPYGSYKLNVKGYDAVTISLDVEKGEKGGTDHTLTIRGDESMFGGAFDRIEVTVNATDKSSAKKPDGRSVDISDYDLNELGDLVNEIGEVLYGEMMEGTLGDLIYSGMGY